MPLIDKILKNTKGTNATLLSQSKIFNNDEYVKTEIPMLNVALSGEIDKGFMPGILTIAGPSKHYKTLFGILLAKAFQDKYENGVVLFYDSEGGAPKDYFIKNGIDTDRVVHIKVHNIEELKFNIFNVIKDLEDDERIFVLIDSIGNIASKKEAEDALNEKSAADMTRAKEIKSLFRIVTPYIAEKNIYLVAINHTYKEMSMYPKDIVSGGTGIHYSSNDIWIISRRQDKEGQEIVGFDFVIKINKSRLVKEDAKIPIHVGYDDGMDKYSGLFDIAVELGYIEKVSQGWYSIPGSDKKMRMSEIVSNTEFFDELLSNEDFKQKIKEKYKLNARH